MIYGRRLNVSLMGPRLRPAASQFRLRHLYLWLLLPVGLIVTTWVVMNWVHLYSWL